MFPVAITYGNTKPTNLDFMQEVVADLQNLLTHGLQCGYRVITVALSGIVCDAPARTIIKSVKQYSGYHSCDKCDQKREWLQKVTYQQIHNLNLRTNFSF